MAGWQQSVPVRYCAAPCPTAKAPSRRCWWLCFGSCARRPGRVGSRPRGSPQWRASGATDADAIRHQVGARSSQIGHRMTRHAGYAATAVRPDGSRNPRSCVVPMQKSQRWRYQPCSEKTFFAAKRFARKNVSQLYTAAAISASQPLRRAATSLRRRDRMVLAAPTRRSTERRVSV